VVTSQDGTQFRENILFTHRGLSGPAILQISSFWRAGQAVIINLLPDFDLAGEIHTQRKLNGSKSLKNLLITLLPKRFVEIIVQGGEIADKAINQLSHTEIDQTAQFIHQWQISPNGTEGYRTAEVTLGGVNSAELSSKTFEANKVNGLYFIGEVTEVTGWLGGYNFQYAWSSGWACGQVC
jgi:hypothetical protein